MQQLVRAKSAWASLLKPDFSPDESSTLMQMHLPTIEGKKTFAVDPDAVLPAKNKWSTAIIGQVMGNSSSFFNMKKFAEEKWTSKGLLEVQRKEADLFIFRFQSEDSKQSILDLSPLPFGNRVLFLWPWSPDKPIQRLSLNSVPVWIKFPDLRLHHFHPQVLSGLGSLVGKPMFMDKPTAAQKRVSFARICVEVNAGAELPKFIQYSDENGLACTQEVIFEWMPIQCHKCKTFGHNCDQTNQKTVVPGSSPQAITENKIQTTQKMKNQNKNIHFSRPSSPTPKHKHPTTHSRIVGKDQKQNTNATHSINHGRNQNTGNYVPNHVPSSSRPGRRSQNTFAPLADIASDGSDPYVSPTKEKTKDLSHSQEDLASDDEDDDLLDMDYDQTLAEHVRNINTKLDKSQKDASWYLSSSEEDNAVGTPTELVQETPPVHGSPPLNGQPSKMKSIITKGSSSRTKVESATARLPKATPNTRSSSPSPSSRHRNRSRGRLRGAKSKR